MWLGFRTLRAILASKSASNKLATLVVANPFFDFALTKNSNWILVRGGSHNPKSQKGLLQTSFCGFFKYNNPVHICSKITKAKALYIRPGEIFWRENRNIKLHWAWGKKLKRTILTRHKSHEGVLIIAPLTNESLWFSCCG